MQLMILLSVRQLVFLYRCVVPENIHSSPLQRAKEIQREGFQKEAVSERVGVASRVFFWGGGGGFRVWFISKQLLILMLSVIQSKNYCFRNTIVVGSCKNFRLSICCFVTQYIVVFNVISGHVLIRLLLTFFQLKGNNWSSLFWEMVSLVWCTAVSPPWFSMTIGQLHDDDIWLQLPEFNSVLLCYLNFSIPLRIKEQ